MELMVMEEQVEPAKFELDDEDTEALLIDCYAFIERVIGRSGNPKWLEKEGHQLIKQLTEVLAWHKLQ